jgi:hypothetical protein
MIHYVGRVFKGKEWNWTVKKQNYPSALYEIIRGGNVGALFVGKHL